MCWVEEGKAGGRQPDYTFVVLRAKWSIGVGRSWASCVFHCRGAIRLIAGDDPTCAPKGVGSDIHEEARALYTPDSICEKAILG